MKYKFVKNKKNFHFPCYFSKEKVLRIMYYAYLDVSTFADMHYIAHDYRMIIEQGYLRANRIDGFWFDYSKYY